MNKPFWIYFSTNNQTDKELFNTLPISIVPFIWIKTQEKLKYNCKNVYDFIKIWYWKLKKKLWKNATVLRLELSWVNAFVVKKSKTIKSMSRWRSFNNNITNNKEYLKKQLITNFNWLYEDFITKELELKTLSIYFRDKSFSTNIYSYNLLEHSYIRSDLLKVILILFEENLDNNTLYRSTWVVFSNFRSYKPYQTSIFDKPLRDKTNYLQLAKIVNKINQKYWSHKLCFWAELLWKKPWIKLWIRK